MGTELLSHAGVRAQEAKKLGYLGGCRRTHGARFHLVRISTAPLLYGRGAVSMLQLQDTQQPKAVDEIGR